MIAIMARISLDEREVWTSIIDGWGAVLLPAHPSLAPEPALLSNVGWDGKISRLIEIFDDLLWPRHRISHERAVKWGGIEGNVEGQSLLRVVVRASAGRAGRLWQGHRVESVAMVQCKDAARDPRLFPT
jgi:hypothetical protein